MWVRGSQADYDYWEAQGNDGWGFDDLLPYFRRVETDPFAATSDLHGGDGPVPITRVDDGKRSVIEQSILTVADELGFEQFPDMNGDTSQRPGVGRTPSNIADGVRMNPALTYINQARARPNLTILDETLVDRVIFDSNRATGVRTSQGETLHGGEIILASGSYSSPAILMRSGVGPAEHLESLKINVVRDLPGVGRNLMDHPISESNLCAFIVNSEAEPDGPHVVRYYIKARSQQVSDEIDLHIYYFELFDDDLQRWKLFVRVSLMYSRSCGSVRLASADPHDPPLIDLNYFENPTDLEALCDGVEIAHRLVELPPTENYLTRHPDALDWHSRDQLRSLMRETVGTTHHPSSTCRMGPADDPMAVVDNQGRVYGIEGLRVADASIFPYSPRANLHFTICAVAEKIADAVRAS